MRKIVYKKYWVFIVIFLFLGSVILPSISGYIEKTKSFHNENVLKFVKSVKEFPINNPTAAWKEQAKLFEKFGAPYGVFEWSVSIDGDYALIGAPWHPNIKGAAYVFKRDGSTWIQEAELTASDGFFQDDFGSSVSLDGDYALIGAQLDSDNGPESGSAYVFKRDGSNWTQEYKLTALDAESDDHFGYTVSLDGDYALIGAPYDDYPGVWNSGSAYIFKRSGTTWIQEDKLTNPDIDEWDLFGCSVSLDGDYALVGAEIDDEASGSAYIFKRDGSTWIQEDKLTASGSTHTFGCSVSLDGNFALIGARNTNSKGSAYVFHKNTTPSLSTHLYE